MDFRYISSIIIRLAMAALFISSAYYKLYPIEYFEYHLYKIGFSWFWIQWISRLLISVEFFLGLVFLFYGNLKKYIIPSSIGLLVFFTLYLVYQILTTGNSGNCGCFGNAFMFTPLEGIIKNIATILFLILLYFTDKLPIYLSNLWSKIGLAICLSLPIILILATNPPDALIIFDRYEGKVLNKNPNLELLYQSEKFAKPTVDFRTGKHVLALLSLTCGHCRLAALKFHTLMSRKPNLPIYMILNGEDQNLSEFFEKTLAKNVPYSRLNGKGFIELSEYEVPQILFINNGVIEKKVSHITLTDVEIEEWLKHN